MAYKPILFGGQMVRAILDGHKTMTRRVVKKKYDNTDLGMRTDKYGTRLVERQNDTPSPERVVNPDGSITTRRALTAIREVVTPYRPGDILWVRETCREFCGMVYVWWGGAYTPGYDFSGLNYRVDDAHMRTDEGFWGEMFVPFEDSKIDLNYEKWRSPIYMPKEAARIFLRVVGVRVERLQEITDEDAKAEGANWLNGQHVGVEEKMRRTAVERFADLWDSLNAKRGYGWDVNPWVWAITFERVGKPAGWPHDRL